MANIEVKAQQREEVGSKVKKLRKQGLIPAVVYGHKFTSTAISVDAKEFKKKVLASGAGRNLIFTLQLSRGGKPFGRGKDRRSARDACRYPPAR